MYDAINEAMFEFALTIKHAMQRGWEIESLFYGERRLGVGPSLTLKRGDEKLTIYSPDDLSHVIQRECEEEDRKKWERGSQNESATHANNAPLSPLKGTES